MSRFKTVSAEHICSLLFLHQLATSRSNRLVKKQAVNRALWFATLNTSAAIAQPGNWLRSAAVHSGRWGGGKNASDPISHTCMLLSTLIGRDRLSGHPHGGLIARYTGLNEVNK